MRGPYHEFVLVDRRQHGYGDYLALIGSAEALRLPDDLVAYLNDTLGWVPTLSPFGSGAAPSKGLNLHGPTAIEAEGAAVLGRILAGWEIIFSQAPDELILTGHWIEPDQEYERLAFRRDDVLRLLRELRQLASGVNDKHYLMHLGI